VVMPIPERPRSTTDDGRTSTAMPPSWPEGKSAPAWNASQVRRSRTPSSPCSMCTPIGDMTGVEAGIAGCIACLKLLHGVVSVSVPSERRKKPRFRPQ
jgi:hypothetical protein